MIGAGASGLAAATALHVAGRATVCLEARDRIGGRLFSASTSHPERGLDLGATWFWDGEERVRALAARSGIETFDQHLAGDTLLQETTGGLTRGRRTGRGPGIFQAQFRCLPIDPARGHVEQRQRPQKYP
ncbi:putrescine oxidase [Streptomyces jeddahensis]|uniref:Putrescine oxidase n=1 Tax=Streptomyces jeddahensis TaxID=1716141 RepID=A0A177HRU2_9ACTN|nr:putrescine oxidase [Streptomyces jeddahensis]